MELFLFILIFGFIVAMIARSKGRNPVGWFLYGVAIFPIALVHALLITAPDPGRAPCPKCAEPVKREATLCPHCRSTLDEGWAQPSPSA